MWLKMLRDILKMNKEEAFSFMKGQPTICKSIESGLKDRCSVIKGTTQIQFDNAQMHWNALKLQLRRQEMLGKQKWVDDLRSLSKGSAKNIAKHLNTNSKVIQDIKQGIYNMENYVKNEHDPVFKLKFEQALKVKYLKQIIKIESINKANELCGDQKWIQELRRLINGDIQTLQKKMLNPSMHTMIIEGLARFKRAAEAEKNVIEDINVRIQTKAKYDEYSQNWIEALERKVFVEGIKEAWLIEAFALLFMQDNDFIGEYLMEHPQIEQQLQDCLDDVTAYYETHKENKYVQTLHEILSEQHANIKDIFARYYADLQQQKLLYGHDFDMSAFPNPHFPKNKLDQNVGNKNNKGNQNSNEESQNQNAQTVRTKAAKTKKEERELNVWYDDTAEIEYNAPKPFTLNRYFKDYIQRTYYDVMGTDTDDDNDDEDNYNQEQDQIDDLSTQDEIQRLERALEGATIQKLEQEKQRLLKTKKKPASSQTSDYKKKRYTEDEEEEEEFDDQLEEGDEQQTNIFEEEEDEDESTSQQLQQQQQTQQTQQTQKAQLTQQQSQKQQLHSNHDTEGGQSMLKSEMLFEYQQKKAREPTKYVMSDEEEEEGEEERGERLAKMGERLMKQQQSQSIFVREEVQERKKGNTNKKAKAKAKASSSKLKNLDFDGIDDKQ